MKRIVICTILLILAVTVSLYAHFRVEKVNEELDMRIDAMNAALMREDKAELLEHAEDFIEFWTKEEDELVHLVRHSYIDIITTGVMRLPSLAKYGNFCDLSAELAVIRRQMEHIRNSEMFAFDNLL